jgi:hypothetical protein
VLVFAHGVANGAARNEIKKMISKVRSFTLKQKDFASGKMVSPPREFWAKCDCCGKAIVKGAEMSNGDRIGDDCLWTVEQTKMAAKFSSVEKFFKMAGTPAKVQKYATYYTL